MSGTSRARVAREMQKEIDPHRELESGSAEPQTKNEEAHKRDQAEIPAIRRRDVGNDSWRMDEPDPWRIGPPPRRTRQPG
jgi:hypothetical protein